MYSMLLMASVVSAGDTASFGKRKGGGCDGGGCYGTVVAAGCYGGGYSGCYGSGWGSGCYGGGSGCDGGGRRGFLGGGGGGFLGGRKNKGGGGCSGYSAGCHGYVAPAADCCGHYAAPVASYGCHGSYAAPMQYQPNVMPYHGAGVMHHQGMVGHGCSWGTAAPPVIHHGQPAPMMMTPGAVVPGAPAGAAPMPAAPAGDKKPEEKKVS